MLEGQPSPGRSLGKSGQKVSALCFGGWQAAGWDSSNEEKFVTSLSLAIESGINFIDTAPSYGKGLSESLIGSVIQRYQRSDLVIATKFNHYESQPKRVRLSVERSLRRLNCDYIDLLQQHWPAQKPSFMKTLEELLKLKEEGVIRAIGVCNWLEPEFTRIPIDALAEIDVLQSCYSVLWRTVESLRSFCTEHSISLLAYSPLAQGLLADPTIINTPFADHRSKNILFGDRYRSPVAQAIASLQAVATAHGASLAQVALAWLLHQEPVCSVIMGVSCPQQLQENIGALQIALTEEDIQMITNASMFFRDAFGVRDTMWGWHSLGGSTDESKK